jgi:hypothetical protein
VISGTQLHVHTQRPTDGNSDPSHWASRDLSIDRSGRAPASFVDADHAGCSNRRRSTRRPGLRCRACEMWKSWIRGWLAHQRIELWNPSWLLDGHLSSPGVQPDSDGRRSLENSFLLGGMFGFIAMWLRRWLSETPVFEEMRKRARLSHELPSGVVLKSHARAVVTSLLSTWKLTAAIVVVILMTPSLLPKLFGIASSQAQPLIWPQLRHYASPPSSSVLLQIDSVFAVSLLRCCCSLSLQPMDYIAAQRLC